MVPVPLLLVRGFRADYVTTSKRNLDLLVDLSHVEMGTWERVAQNRPEIDRMASFPNSSTRNT